MNSYMKWLAMPVSLSCVSEISAYHFLNFQSLDELWFVRVGPASFKDWRAVESETRKIHAHSSWFLFWISASWPPLFLPSYGSTSLSKHLTLWKFWCIASEPKILWKRWICLNILQAILQAIWTFSLALSIFPLLSACGICPYIALNRQSQNIPVGFRFSHRRVKNCNVLDRDRNIYCCSTTTKTSSS